MNTRILQSACVSSETTRSQKRSFTNAGFTLVELIVTLGIFSMMTSVVLAQYHSFSINADFSNSGEDILLAMREAQTYGAVGNKAVVECGVPASIFNCVYGVHFDASQKSYTIFIDNNGSYGEGESVGAPTILKVSKMILSSGGETLDVTFKRPNVDAIISGGSDSATITLTSMDGSKTLAVSVSKTGQMSVK